MCGIIGYTGPRQVVPILLDGLRKLEYRGYDSAGVAVVSLTGTKGPEIGVVRCKGKIAVLAEQLGQTPLHGPCGIGHTRWATHGRPSEQNAHRHRAGRVAVVHNGIIENHAELRAELAAEGRAFISETDTEVIAHLIERALAHLAHLGDLDGHRRARDLDHRRDHADDRRDPDLRRHHDRRHHDRCIDIDLDHRDAVRCPKLKTAIMLDSSKRTGDETFMWDDVAAVDLPADDRLRIQKLYALDSPSNKKVC